MKSLILLTLACAICNPIYGQQKGAHPSNDQNEAKNGQGAAVGEVQKNCPSPNTDDSKKNSPSYFERLFSPESIPNIFLVIVGGCGVGVAVCTLKSIERQTKAAVVSAHMAKGGVDVLISKERARVRVDLMHLPKAPEDFPAFRVAAKVTVSGGTEAAIRETVFTAEMVRAGEIPRFELLLKSMRGMPPVLRQSETVEVVDFALSFDGFESVFKGSSFINARGFIRYTDVFKGRWISRFNRRYRYLFLEDGEIIGGSWEDFGDTPESNGEYPDHDET